MMTWPEWVNAVLRIGQSRGLAVYHEPMPGATAPGAIIFHWRSLGTPDHGIAGAAPELIANTTPEAFTFLWRGAPARMAENPRDPESPVPAEPWDRHGRYVPRIPARACCWALETLFTGANYAGRP